MIEASSSPSERCDPESFRQVIGHFASGVTVLTARNEGTRFGMTASAVSSLSVEPPMLLACINRRAPTGAAIAGSGAFGLSILGEQHGYIADRFSAPRRDKFEGLELVEGALGVPMLADALARLECRVTERVQGGTHSVFIAEVVRAEARPGAPLAYFRGRFGRLELSEDLTVYEELRAKVLSGGLEADERLDIPTLAAELGAEPWHVHHALGRLAGEGLIARDRDRGYVVAPVLIATIEDALDGRRVIELGTAERSVGRVSAYQLEELRRRMEATLPLIRRGRFVDIDRYSAANAAFHEFMVELAGSEASLLAFRRLGIPGIMARTLRRSEFADDGLLDDHRALVQAYERADLARAKAVIERHTERSKQVHRRALAAAEPTAEEQSKGDRST